MPQLTLPRCYSTRLIFVAMVLLLTGSASFAQNSVWNAGSGNWTDNNWTTAAPSSTSNVFIDNGNPVASTVVLNVSATVNNLTLDPSDTLTLAPNTTLIVNGTATLNGTTNVALGALTLNDASSNSGAINLATETEMSGGQTILVGEGRINGAGTLANTQLIQGAGNIGIALVNSGNVLATDPNRPLGVSGNVNNAGGELAGRSGTLVLNGSTVTSGTVDGNLAGTNGATLNNVLMGAYGIGVSVADGSTLAIQGTVTVTNNGPLKLGNGVTLTGPGTLVNSTAPTPLGAGIVAVSGEATLQVNVTQTAGSGGLIGEGGTLVLDGSTVSGGFVLGTLAGKNGATLNNLQIGVPSAGAVSFANGSTFTVQGTVTNVANALNLGDGVTLTGPGTLVNSNSGESEIIVSEGRGTLGVNVIQTGDNILWGQASGTLVLDRSTVTGGYVRGNLATMNGATLDNVQMGIDTGDTVSLADGSTLGIKQTVTNAGTLSLGAGGTGATLNSVPSLGIVGGLPTLVSGLLVNNGTIHGGGTLAVDIANNGTIVADNASTPLVLADNVTSPTGSSVFRAMDGGTLTVNSSASGQIVDIQTGGKLNGTGTINVNDSVGNSGIVTPGVNAPGTLTINGIYSQAYNGTTDFLLGGGQAGQYSQLNVNGFAFFDSGSVIDASFFNGFDPSAACADVTGVCEMFDVLHLTDGTIETVVTNPITMTTTDILGIAGLDFELPTLANGLTWSEVDLNNQDLELEVVSSGEGSYGGGGGTNVPEPSSLLLLAVGMIGLGILRARRRGVGSLA